VLRESDDRFRQLAEHVREVFWLLEVSTGQVLYLNDAFRTVFDRPTRPVYDDRNAWLDSVHADDRAEIENLHASIEKGIDNWDVEYRIVRPNGEVRWLHERAFPVAAPGGAAFRIAGIADDITALKTSLEENRHYQLRLQELTRELDQARESEQHRIAATLHDDVGQNLAVVRIRLGPDGARI
jgi:PAS domain S-box-containing protein